MEMELLYLVCAVVGGTLIVCQFVMTLLGIGGDSDLPDHDASTHDGVAGAHDAAHDGYTAWFFGMLTFRTLSAAIAFFGLTGLAASEQLEPGPTVLLAIGAGLVALVIVGTLMRTLYKLNLDGTVRIERTVGSRGTVYLPVPGNRAGVGKVMVSHANRRLEYKAVTAQENLPSGSAVVVVGVVGPDTVEVAPATEERAL